MLEAIFTKRFEKDVKLAIRRRKDIKKLKVIIGLLLNQEVLPVKYRDHYLIGNYNDRKECHIESDWLLIYLPKNKEIIFERTGSHSDLFR